MTGHQVISANSISEAAGAVGRLLDLNVIRSQAFWHLGWSSGSALGAQGLSSLRR